MGHLPPHPPPSSGGRSSRDAARGVFTFGFILGFDQRGRFGSARQRLALQRNRGGAFRCGRGSDHREVHAGWAPSARPNNQTTKSPNTRQLKPSPSSPIRPLHLRTQIPRPQPRRFT
jgi:hypothetical protein